MSKTYTITDLSALDFTTSEKDYDNSIYYADLVIDELPDEFKKILEEENWEK